MCRPYRAIRSFIIETQGVALGWLVSGPLALSGSPHSNRAPTLRFHFQSHPPSRDTREVSGYLRPNTMNTLTVQLPDSLHRSIQALVDREGYSIDQFLASAAAEKMAALTTLDFLRREAAQGRREDFDTFLAAVPHGPVPETDRLPE